MPLPGLQGRPPRALPGSQINRRHWEPERRSSSPSRPSCFSRRRKRESVCVIPDTYPDYYIDWSQHDSLFGLCESSGPALVQDHLPGGSARDHLSESVGRTPRTQALSIRLGRACRANDPECKMFSASDDLNGLAQLLGRHEGSPQLCDSVCFLPLPRALGAAIARRCPERQVRSCSPCPFGRGA